MAVIKIRCHCGNVISIYTDGILYREVGWCECSCGCAWSYSDPVKSPIQLKKERDCKELGKEEVKIFKHYPEGLIGGV